MWDSPWGRIGICICYDFSYVTVVDALARLGAEAWVVPTMDVEEWGGYEHRLHSRVGLWRAAEYRVPVFRLASSGVSQVIDPRGRVIRAGGVPGPGEIVAGTLMLGGPARRPVDRWLVWPALGIAGLVLAWGLATALGRRGRRGKPDPV